MKVLVTLSETGHPLLFEEISALGARYRANRIRALAELGLRVERGMEKGPVARTPASCNLARPALSQHDPFLSAVASFRSAVIGLGDND